MTNASEEAGGVGGGEGQPLLAALLLFVAAAALAIAGQAAPADLARGVFYALAGAMALMGLYAFFAVMAGRSRAEGGGAFAALFAAAGDPAAITDAELRVLEANDAARARAGEIGETRFAGEFFSAWDADADGAVYRLARAASAGRSAVERLNVADPLHLRARPLPGGRLLWSVEPAPNAPTLDAEEAPFAQARLARTGAFRGENPVFAAFAVADRAAIRAAAEGALAAGKAHAVVRLEDGRRRAIALHRRQDGDAKLILYPEWSAETEGREAIFEQLPVALARITPEGRVVSANAAARALLGAAAAPGAAFDRLIEGFGRPMGARIAEAAAGETPQRPELARGRLGDRDVFLQVSFARLDFDGGASVLAVMSDATELKTLEQQFVQSQKMQAVGQLAGGVAHDFNNLLTAILGHCDLLMMRKAQTSPEFADLSQIRQNANRAAALVRQLLAFSRKQTLRPEAVRIADSLSELLHLLNRLLGEQYEMRLNCAPELWPVWIDAQQFEQVVMNLVVNARDAMPEGGAVSITASNVSYESEIARDRALVPAGDYVSVEVADTGVGIREDLVSKIFEPFYTTKKTGEGTGLGLSTVYGIVKQTGGFIFVDSAAGRGTVFTILLPRLVAGDGHAGAEEGEAAGTRPTGDLTGSGRILLVEDEAPVRAFASRALKLRGYEVVEADSAETALELLADPDLVVDLMISDVVMPGLDGPSWVRRARAARPDVGVIFISGYAEDVFRRGMEGVENYHFLPKPFSLDELATAAKTAMGGAGGGRPA